MAVLVLSLSQQLLFCDFMPPLKAGDLVKGKSKLLLRKRGRVVEVISDGPKKKYRVDWTDSTSGVIFGRSLEISDLPTG